MKYFTDVELHYLENKYHNTQEPFDPYARMKYHGGEYDPATGLDDDAMHELLASLDLTGLPHPVAKAKAFAAVLDNARIDVNKNDWFVGFYNWGRPISFCTQGIWNAEVMSRIPEENARRDVFGKTGSVAIWPDFDHVIPNWDALMQLGFPGLLERTRGYHEKARADGTLDAVKDAFYTGIELTYEAILRLLDRYVRLAGAEPHAKAARQAKCLADLRDGAPQDFYEALQAIYIFFILCECVDNYQTRSLGNGIDSTLYPFYTRDLAAGTYTRDELKVFMAGFLMQYSAIGNYWGHPMYMGGTNADGSTKYNDLSRDIIDVYGDLGIYNPKVQIKVAENTPKDILYKVFSLVRSGKSSFVFCCEPGMRRAVMSYGATPDEAREFEISGCYETRVRSDESSTGTGYVNALKAVELALHNGIDPKTGLQVGRKTGTCADLKTFPDFYHAFLIQWMTLVDDTIQIANSFEGYLDEINPSNMYTATIERALRNGLDGYAFGVRFNNSSILNCAFASAVDAVMAVKTLVYEEQAATLEEMVQATDADWVGYETLRRKALNCPHKYGRRDPETDMLAASMARIFANRVNGRPNARGGVYKAIMHSAMQFVLQGEKTGATPDGRKSGEETSKNASPTNGMDKEGVTALIQSALNLEPWSYPESFCLDVMLHPSAVQGETGLAVMDALVMTYLAGGGMSIQFNICDAGTLRDAQAHPEKYRNLQIRVCGWNALWNNLPKVQQDAIIRRAEHNG